jgi:hypothetical protein
MNESPEQHVAQIVGRALEPIELAKYPNMDALPAAVTELVAVVAMKHNTTLAAKYLFGRVRGTAIDLEEQVHRFTEQWMSQWTPADELRARSLVDRELGLNDKVTTEDMKDTSSELTAITAALGEHDFTLACKYVLHRVPNLHLWGAMSWMEMLLHPQETWDE